MTHVAFYLKNAEAELAFAEPNASDVFHSASEPLGALIEDETVLSATNKARQAGVRPSMHLRTATAFAPGLSLLRADQVRLPDFLKALRARLAPFVSSMQFVQNPFETDSVLLTAKCLTGDRRLIQKAALSPLTPKVLRIGFGLTESDALLSAVTGRQLTLETAASMKIAELLPDRISQTVPVEFTLGGLLSDSTASADSPSLTTLRSLLRGDSDCFTVLPLESTFSFRKEGRSASPESATEARLCEAAYALAGWLQARRIHPGRVTLTLETANGDAVTTCEPTSSEAQVLASELLRRLRQTPHEAVTPQRNMLQQSALPPTSSGGSEADAYSVCRDPAIRFPAAIPISAQTLSVPLSRFCRQRNRFRQWSEKKRFFWRTRMDCPFGKVGSPFLTVRAFTASAVKPANTALPKQVPVDAYGSGEHRARPTGTCRDSSEQPASHVGIPSTGGFSRAKPLRQF